jgi:molecular chaperone GrpE
MSTGQSKRTDPAAEDAAPGTANPESEDRTDQTGGGAQAGSESASDAGDANGESDHAAAEIARLTAENEKLRDQALRAMAETENIRRRTEREKEDTAKYAVTKLARDLLDVADNLRRALDAVPAETIEASEDLRKIVDGVAATEKGLIDTFDRHGITRIDPQDEKFDPNFHQAMMEVPATGKPGGTVVQVLAPGYVIHGWLLRAAMVAVAASGEPPQRVDTSA